MANVKGSYGRFGCVQNAYGKLLLVQRGWFTDSKTGERKFDGRYNYPGGGVDEDDAKNSRTPEQIVAREVEEETSYRVRILDFRPVGEYPTAQHSDIAITYLCEVIDGHLKKTEEGVAFKWVNPAEAMELAKKGDVSGGLVGGIRTSTGGVPRHIQMVLHFFTRVCYITSYREIARKYCKELGIPI